VKVGVGLAFTVTALVVAVQPAVVVNVNVALPAPTPLMTPELLMVAMPELELDQVPPVVGLAVIVEPTQTELAATLTVTDDVVCVITVEFALVPHASMARTR
jgi:hypothetical protein